MASATEHTPPDVAVVAPSTPPAPRISTFRRLLPFLVAILLLGFVASRLDYRAFVDALKNVDVVPYVAFGSVFQVSLLCADALGNYAAYRRTMPGVRWRDLFLYRGASYVPGMVNHHLGQAYMTYLMSRLARVPLARMAGATLVSYACWFGCLLGCVAIALPFSNLPIHFVPVIVGAGLAYLIVIGTKPAFLSRVTLLAPLFEAGLRGHAVALLARVPHLAVIVLGTWASYAFFDVAIPPGTALVYVPILLVATTLPIAPQGFGTRDALAAQFFVAYATGETEAARLGQLAACTTTWGVLSTIAGAGLGLLCGRVVTRRLAALAK
jgi:hypothetical protein